MNRICSVLVTMLITVVAIAPGLLIMIPQDYSTNEVIEVFDTDTTEITVDTSIETDTQPEETIVVETDILSEQLGSTTITPETTVEVEIETVPVKTEGITEETIVEVKPVTTPEAESIDIISNLKVDKNDKLSLIAAVVYQEMGGDYACDDCRRRVADTILNRVASPYFPNTIYEVLTQGKLQYGFDSTTGVYWQERCKNPGEAHAVERAYRIAEEVLNGKHSDIYGKDYIWQAEFIQGVNNIYCCNTYFGQRDKNKEW